MSYPRAGKSFSGGLYDYGGAIFNVKHPAFGAVGDGTTDDTAAIQAAIDAAQALLDASANTSVPTVVIPAGQYSITDTIIWKSASIFGSQSKLGTQLIWDGTGGDDFVEKSNTYSGGASQGVLQDIGFVNGTNQPGTFVHFTTRADAMLTIQRCRFEGSSANAIEFDDGWFNFFMDHIRFDACGGYAINGVIGSAQNLSAFCLSNFTIDSREREAPGMICLDNTTNNVSNAGTFAIKNGRLEVNYAWGSTNPGVFVLKSPNSSGNVKWVGLQMDNISYQDVVGMGSDVFFYHSTTDNFEPASIVLTNVRQQGLSAVFGGNWRSWAFPLQGSYPFAAFGGEVTAARYAPISGFSTYTELHNSTDPTNIVRVRADTYDRFHVRADGRLEWGSGSGAVDINLFRGGADELETDDALTVGGTTTVPQLVITTTSPRAIWLDSSSTTDNKRWDIVPVSEQLRFRAFNDAGSVFTTFMQVDRTGTTIDLVQINAPLTVTGRVRQSTVTTLANDATPSVSAGNLFETGGTTTITDFDDGVVGQTIVIKADHSITITDNASIILAGGANFDMVSGDTLTLTMFDDQVWQEVSRSVN